MIGVCIVAYCSQDVITACLDSLLASDTDNYRIAVCDNASDDDTLDVIRQWASTQKLTIAEYSTTTSDYQDAREPAQLTLLRSPQNIGFAGGVNICLRNFLNQDQIDLFWVLNPDSEVASNAVSAYQHAAHTAGKFSFMGGRTVYYEPPNHIQSDGGLIGKWTGVCRNVNQGLLPDQALQADQNTLDFISGANMVVSRAALDQIGLMDESYFLYFEEVDWAARRGDLPLILCPEALVYHHGGTAIGSGSVTRAASGFANYFNYRNRLRYLWKFHKYSLPTGYAYSLLKIGQLILKRGSISEIDGAFRGLHQLPPPRNVRARLAPDAAALAFGEKMPF